VRAIYVGLERVAAKASDALVVVSDRDRAKGLRAGIGFPAQYELIRSGIDLRLFDRVVVDRVAKRREFGVPPDGPLIGSVARLSPQKDPLTFVDMAAEVAARVPNARFLLVGDGPIRPAVEARVRDHGLQDQVLLLGLRRDIPEVLSLLDVFVVCSLWEGMPRTLLQAMAAGIPVVATRVDGIAEAVVDGVTGFLASPRDSAAIASRVVQLLSDEGLSKRLGAEAKQRVEAFSVERMLRGLEALYGRLAVAKRLGYPG